MAFWLFGFCTSSTSSGPWQRRKQDEVLVDEVPRNTGETGEFSGSFLSCSCCLMFLVLFVWSLIFDLLILLVCWLVGLLVLVLMVVVVGCCHRPWPHGGVDVLLLAGFNAAGREPNNQKIPAPLGTPKKALLLKIFPRWWFQIFRKKVLGTFYWFWTCLSAGLVS